jgi:hypothetical protein
VALVGGAAAVASAFYVGHGLSKSNFQDKQRHSFEILASQNSEHFVRARDEIDAAFRESGGKNALDAAKIQGNVDLAKAATLILGYYEDMSIAVQTHYADEETLKRSLRRLVLDDWKILENYIELVRKPKGAEKRYCEFEDLQRAWNADTNLSVRVFKIR